ncbi:MAG: acyl-ACP thioesterase [Culturomica sp.]|jgi:acyl-ACP thioesterase|nr:acyl-ACP thioesterase [Culturomica sp.]
MEKYTKQVRIHNHYTDFRGSLFVKILCDLLNDTAEEQTELLGIDVGTLNREGQTWMLHRLHLILHRLPGKEEEVIVETWLSGIDRLFALRDYRMLRTDGEELVRGTSEWMLIDLHRRRPVRPSGKLMELNTRNAIEKMEIPYRLNEKKVREMEMSHCRPFVATFDNIDFNGHVTQASYMRWLTNALPFGFLTQHLLTEVEVLYEHEILPDSPIHSYYRIFPGDRETIVRHQIWDREHERLHCLAESVWTGKACSDHL